MKIAFFELEKWEEEYLKEKLAGQDVEFHTTKAMDKHDDSTFQAEVVGSFVFSPFDKKTLNEFPNLKFIATMSVGFDHIDLVECKKRGITVCNVPAYAETTVSEHTFALILTLSRNIHKAFLRTSQDYNFSYDGLMGFDLRGKTLGVVGTGRIGLATIHLAKCFGMNVVANDAFPRKELEEKYGFKYVSFDELLGQSDIVTLHVPLLKETEHLINREAISKLKNGALLINTSRGAVIDTDALVEGLDSGKIGGAGLDVLEGELLIKDEKEVIHSLNTLPKEQIALLLKNQNLMQRSDVIVTPHLAFYSKEALQRILDTTLENIYDYIEKRGFKNEVKPPK